MTTLTLTIPAATRLSEVVELGTLALIEREQRPMRAVLIDTAPAERPATDQEASDWLNGYRTPAARETPEGLVVVDRDNYLATFQAAPVWPLSRQEF